MALREHETPSTVLSAGRFALGEEERILAR